MKRRFGLAATPLLLLAVTSGAKPALERPDPDATCPGASCGQLLFVGTRSEGPGRGIEAARFDNATGRLTGLGVVAEVTNPTWLVASPHRPIVYAVSEIGNDGRAEGAVLSFAADKRSGALRQISRVGSGGGGATHLQIVAHGPSPAILVANYGTGQVSAIPLGKAGSLSRPSSILTEVGSGPTPRQRSAHPHGTAIDLSGRYVFVADLGADRIFVDRFDPATGRLTADHAVALPPGSGPRHIVASSDGRTVYANAEFTGDVFVMSWDAAEKKLRLVRTVRTRAVSYSGELSSAELALSADGRFLYVTNRGEDDIVVYAAGDTAGDLHEVQRLSSGGAMPASFAFDPSGRWLAIANAGSDRVSIFRCDIATGKLSPAGEGVAVKNPASVAWLAG